MSKISSAWEVYPWIPVACLSRYVNGQPLFCTFCGRTQKLVSKHPPLGPSGMEKLICSPRQTATMFSWAVATAVIMHLYVRTTGLIW